jgi:hemin uptake protein HemP
MSTVDDQAKKITDRVRTPHEPVAVVSSQVLLGKRRQLAILHNGERYTLRITANDKLILTK